MALPSNRSSSIECIGKYELQALIGEGGMGHVYRALLRGPARATREVAIKVLHANLSADREFILMFLDEMRVAMALSHRNIVQTFDADVFNGRYYMVMELIEGSSLRDLLLRLTPPAVLPLDIALFIGKEISAALDYAHRFRSAGSEETSGVVHRDVSLSNILLSSQGDVKLADFGLAKAAGRMSVSVVNSVKGKLGYMAPEQGRGRACAASDLFSLGAVLYRVLGGLPIRREQTLEAVLAGAKVPASLRALRPEIPPSLERLVMSCLSAWTEDRPSSAAELRDALAQELFQLELTQQLGPDAHARLSRFLSERPAPQDTGPQAGGRLAQQLLRQAQEHPEPLDSARPARSTVDERITLASEVQRTLESDIAITLNSEAQRTLESEVPTPLPGEVPASSARKIDLPVGAWPEAAAPRTRTRWLGASAALLVGLALVLVWALRHRGDERAPVAQQAHLPDQREAAAVIDSSPPPARPHDQGLESRTEDSTPAPLSRRVPPREQRPGAERKRPRLTPTEKTKTPAQLWVMSRKGGRLQWATVVLDGRRVGETPLRLEVVPGRHRLEIRRPGHRDESRSVVLVPGQELKVFFELHEEP